MKNVFYLLSAVLFMTLSFGLTSCGDDDDPEVPVNNQSIVGKWNVSRTVQKYYIIDPVTGEDHIIEDVEEGVGETFEFTTDNLTIHDPAYPDEDETYKYVYNKTNDIILIDGGGNFKIAKLTAKELHLVTEISETGYSATLTIELIRQ